MHELTLTWTENRQVKTQTIYDQQPSKYPGTVRIGRDPARCDIVLSEPTVSGLHVEIFFNQQEKCFYLRNLRHSNPPLVDGKNIIQGEVPLREDSTIYLGQMAIKVLGVSPSASGVPVTVLMPPQQIQQIKTPSQPPASASGTYGLQCPNCDRISPYARLDLGCPWCGTSLAAAVSALIQQ